MAARKSRRGGVRPGAGRKPKPAEERLRNRLMFALADDEYQELVEVAGGEAVSAFVRRLVLRHLGKRRKH